MINYNLLIYEILDRKFEINSWDVNYAEGDLAELSKKLELSETKYPIIWLQTGYRVVEKKGQLELNGCNFFLITKGDEHDLYKKRYETNYQEMLYPLYDKFKQAISKSKGVSLLNQDISFVSMPFNDVTELNSKGKMAQKATIQDIWDAIVIEGLNLRIKMDCYSEFKI